MIATTDKSNGLHTRIIWCCAWTHDSVAFGTGSRDGKVTIIFYLLTFFKAKLRDGEPTIETDRHEPEVTSYHIIIMFSRDLPSSL